MGDSVLYIISDELSFDFQAELDSLSETLSSFKKANKIIKKNKKQDLLLFIIDEKLLTPKNLISFSLFYRQAIESSARLLLYSDNKLNNLYKNFNFDDVIEKRLTLKFQVQKIKLHIESVIQIERLKKVDNLEQVFQLFFSNAPIGVTISSSSGLDQHEGHLDYFNPAYEKIVGRSKEELLSNNWTTFTHPENLKEELKKHQELLDGKIASYSIEKRYIRPDGKIVWAFLIASILDLKPYRYISLVQDVTAQKEIEFSLAESERSRSTFFRNLPGVAYRCKNDEFWTMEFVSEGSKELTGYLPNDFINNSRIAFNEIIALNHRERVWLEWQKAVKSKTFFNAEYEIVDISGNKKWVLEKGQGVYDLNGDVEALEGVILDIDNRKKAEDELKFLSQHDYLTKLPNLISLFATLEKDLKNDNKKAIIGLNLTTLHQLSLTYGFFNSQQILIKLADSLKEQCLNNVSLFSIYENYLVLYVKDYEDKSSLIAQAEKASAIVEESFSLEHIGWGVGLLELSNYSTHDTEQILKDLMATTNKSLVTYSTKFEIIFFDDKIEEEISRENEITKELINYVEDEKSETIYLLYQPIVRVTDDKPWAVEALARMHFNSLGIVKPSEFISIAEKTKIIIPLGKKLIQSAVKFIKEVHDSGFDEILLSINISPIQLLDKSFIPFLDSIIKENNLKSSSLILEITENEVALNHQEINAILAKLKAKGYHTALDDFGTGYSSLAKERELHIDCIKIDKLFISELTSIAEKDAITGDIVKLAQKLNQCVVAEGVEYPMQMAYLKKVGCNYAQGYLISRPVSEKEIFDFLERK